MNYFEYQKHRLAYINSLYHNKKPEIESENGMEEFFSNWFTVYRQVRSLCGTSKIDILMYHQSDFNKATPIGIEVKRTDIKRGADLAKWLKQASRYTHCYFHEKKAHIFVSPQIAGNYLDEGRFINQHDINNAAQHNVQGFLYGAFGVGELQKYTFYGPPSRAHCQLVINTKIIWDSRYPNSFNYRNLPEL